MTNSSLRVLREKEQFSSIRANALADRLERGVLELVKFAASLDDAQWARTLSPADSRTIATIVHHVGNMLPLEIQLAQMIAAGKPIEGVTFAEVAAINAGHAGDFPLPAKEVALEFLRTNAASAAAAIRILSDEELDRATPNSLYGDAVLTCQFMLEDHAVRHAVHHLARLRTALNR